METSLPSPNLGQKAPGRDPPRAETPFTETPPWDQTGRGIMHLPWKEHGTRQKVTSYTSLLQTINGSHCSSRHASDWNTFWFDLNFINTNAYLKQIFLIFFSSLHTHYSRFTKLNRSLKEYWEVKDPCTVLLRSRQNRDECQFAFFITPGKNVEWLSLLRYGSE